MTSVPFRSRSAFVVAALTLASIAAGCGSDSTAPVKKDVVPATITPSATDTLRATAGNSVGSLTVTVKNAEGQPIDTATVTFAVVTGGGSLSATSVKTDTTGVATTTWTLGKTAGVQTVTAAAGTLSPIVFVAVAQAGTATTLAKVAGDNQSAAVGTNVATNPSVKVTDINGNPVPNVLVTFQASNGGSVTNSAANTDATGVATPGSWKLGPTVGPNTLTATANGISAPVTFAATGTAGAASKITITSGSVPPLQIGQTSTITAQAFDANNNQLTSPTFTFSSDNSGVAKVDNNGVITAVASGSANITVALGTITATVPVTVIGHPGTTIVDTLALLGRVKNMVIAGTQAYAALSNSTISNIDLSTGTQGWTLTMPAPIVDIGVNAANTAITAAASNNELYIIDVASHTITDSVALAAAPVKIAMTAAGARVFVDENTFQLEIVDVPSRTVVDTATLAGTLTAMKMGPGDTLVYAATQFGAIMEIDARTGAVRRNYQPSTTVSDFAISPDGKTLAAADGISSIVTLTPLAVGGMSSTIDYGSIVSSVAFTPDQKQLWVAMGNTIYASPSDGNGSYATIFTSGRVSLTGANFKKIAIAPSGTAVLAYDDAGLKLAVIK